MVIEAPSGDVVGVEVKASASVEGKDFAGLRRLAAATGERFRQGLVLYEGDRIVPLGGSLWAAALSTLWA